MASYVFPKVEPADIQRSRRDLSLYKAFTASVGTVIPALCIDMLPDDWMRINTIATVQTLPMVAPVRGRWKVSFDYYYNPWSNIYGFMDNNSRLSTEQIVNMYRYIFVLGQEQECSLTDAYNEISQILPKVAKGGVLDYLGVPVGYFGSVRVEGNNVAFRQTSHPAEGLVTYLDIIRNYYVNNQEADVPYIASNFNSLDGSSKYNRIPFTSLDDFFSNLRYRSNKGLSQATPIDVASDPNVGGFFYSIFNSTNTIDSQIGLFCRSYRMDLLRGIMNESVGEFKSSVVVNNGTFNMDQVYFANKLQTLINRIDITGGRFTDWIRTRWNVDPGIETDRPIYLGSHSMWLNTIDVVATASGSADIGSRNDNSVIGQQVGYQVGKLTTGEGKNSQRAITIKSKQYGTLMCIFSIQPDVVYSQGFELNMLKTKFLDIYDPAFKQLGYQDVLRAEVYAFPELRGTSNALGSYDPEEKIGKRVAWSEYMASLNRVHGDFAYGQSLDFWVNNRIYSGGMYKYDEQIKEAIGDVYDIMHDFDATTYIYPHLWNSQFANTDISAMNYMVDVFFAIDANRSLGKRLMPHM